MTFSLATLKLRPQQPSTNEPSTKQEWKRARNRNRFEWKKKCHVFLDDRIARDEFDEWIWCEPMCIIDRPQHFTTRLAVSNESMNAHRWKRITSTLFAVTSAKWHKRMQFRFPLARNLLPLVNFFASSLTLPFRCERRIVLLHFFFFYRECKKNGKMAIIFSSMLLRRHEFDATAGDVWCIFEWVSAFGVCSVQVGRPPMNAYFKCPNVLN